MNYFSLFMAGENPPNRPDELPDGGIESLPDDPSDTEVETLSDRQRCAIRMNLFSEDARPAKEFFPGQCQFDNSPSQVKAFGDIRRLVNKKLDGVSYLNVMDQIKQLDHRCEQFGLTVYEMEKYVGLVSLFNCLSFSYKRVTDRWEDPHN